MPIIAASFGLITGGLIKNRGELILLGLIVVVLTFVLGNRLRTK